MIPQPVARPRLLPVMAERPKCSSSYLFIWDAMELVGRAKFGDDWTGSELDVLNWPVSPIVERDQRQESFRKLFAQPQPMPALKVRKSSPPILMPSVLSENYSGHATTRLADQKLRERETVWAANVAALCRLRGSSNWLLEQFRNGQIRAFSRSVGKPGEPVAMPPDEWFVEDTFKTRFVAGRYDRWLPRMTRPTPAYIFVDRAGIERAISTLANASAVVTTTDLSACSSYLRFAVAFSLKYRDNLGEWSRPAIEAQLRQDWNMANPTDQMSPTMAERMSYVVKAPDPGAMAIGATGAAAKKKG